MFSKDGETHMDVMTCKVERDQALEYDRVSREGGGQEHEQTRRGASVGDHVQHSSKFRAPERVSAIMYNYAMGSSEAYCWKCRAARPSSASKIHEILYRRLHVRGWRGM